jgi:hypothetical protein
MAPRRHDPSRVESQWKAWVTSSDPMVVRWVRRGLAEPKRRCPTLRPAGFQQPHWMGDAL